MNYETFKRIMDIFWPYPLGIIFLPISLIVAVAIKLESPDGPIFADTPPRVGKNGKLFVTYKFRSMIPNAVNYLKEHPELFEKYKKTVLN